MPKRVLSAAAAERMILANIEGSVTIYEILTWVFGKRRTRDALAAPLDDPEFVAFLMHIDMDVNKAWACRGIARTQGPYVEKINLPSSLNK